MEDVIKKLRIICLYEFGLPYLKLLSRPFLVLKLSTQAVTSHGLLLLEIPQLPQNTNTAHIYVWFTILVNMLSSHVVSVGQAIKVFLKISYSAISLV